MTPRILVSALAIALALGATAARAGDDAAALDPAKAEQVRATLVAQGYEVRSVGLEDGRIEAYAVKDGKLYEIYLDDALTVVETKVED